MSKQVDELIAILLPYAKLAGVSLGLMVTAVLTGRTFKDLIATLLGRIAKKTKNKLDDQLVADARIDLGLGPEAPQEALTDQTNKEEGK